MQTYLVGGAVRDLLMGLPVRDRDCVEVGANAQSLLDLGFIPVGRDFPVFLHPHTKEEYALARTERKTAPGYRGFSVDAASSVTLEEDLSRRDLTINSIAVAFNESKPAIDLADCVDPFGGRHDIDNKILRHTGPAFREDPVRILRLARFAARFPDFKVAPETMAMMQAMVASQEAEHLVAERVWLEFSKGLMEQVPSRMVRTLQACGALQVVMPALHASIDEKTMLLLDYTANQHAALEVRFACLTHGLSGVPAFCTTHRVPAPYADLAALLERNFGEVNHCDPFDGDKVVNILEQCDAFRKPERFALLLEALACIAHPTPYPLASLFTTALQCAQSVNTERVAIQAMKEGKTGAAIGHAVSRARAQSVRDGLKTL
jgi:tRNA nucleotidyltransferase (CCA-adding enzyme)